MPIRRHASLGLLAVFGVASFTPLHSSLRAADAPTVEQVLSMFKPVQKDVEFETPAPEEFAKCRVAVERDGKLSGWVVFGPKGQVLRRFVDTDGNNTVDEWRYYNHGLEVYRDIDTNGDRKPDQCRWFNTGGSRWAIDDNQDGRIDSWKALSPEEAVRLAILAMIHSDEKLLQTVLVTREDLATLGVSEIYSAKLLDAVANPGKKMQSIQATSKVLNEQSMFTRADNLTPATIPAEKNKLRSELFVYENAMAILDVGGKPGLVQIGELVRVGDVWKLTQIPQPIEGANATMAGGILMQPTLAATVAATTESTPGSAEVQKILTELQKLDQESPPPTSGAVKLTEYNAKRADILSRLVAASSSEDERSQWTRQMIDSIASAVQIGAYAEGLDRLKTLEADLQSKSPKSPLVPYIAYRRLLAEYAAQHQSTSSTKQQEVQKWWREKLEKFTKEFPSADDTPEAMLQLAIAQEFIGQMADAKRWYGELADHYPQTKAGKRGAGALRRLDLKGKSFEFAGPALEDKHPISSRDYQGKVLLVAYWSTWCNTCTQDLPALRALYDQYNSKGFEIVGVNIDVTADPVEPFLRQNKVSWPQVFQPGGIESEPAAAFGVIVPPLMILVDRQGKVVAVTTTVDEIKAALPGLLK